MSKAMPEDYWQWVKDNFSDGSFHLRQKEWVAPGRAAEHNEGIMYEAPWEEPFGGFSIHSRRCARALSDVGYLPVQLRSPRGRQMKYAGVTFEEAEREIGDLLLTSVKRYVVRIHQLVPHEGSLQVLVAPPRTMGGPLLTKKQNKALNRRKIIYSVWERTRIPNLDAASLQQVGEAWVACEANANMLRGQGVERVRVIRVPHDPETEPLLSVRKTPRIAGPPRFYNLGKWEPRKAQHTMIGAFLRAFEPHEAQLLIKTSPYAGGYRDLKDYPQDPNMSLSFWANDNLVRSRGWTFGKIRQRVLLNTKVASVQQIQELHRIGDVYVSPSHGEGYDMPAYESSLSGNLLLCTPSGGPLAFVGKHDVVVPSTGDVDCHPWYRWNQSKWIGYEIDALTSSFRATYERWKHLPVRPARDHKNMSKFEYESVGQEMATGIKSVRGMTWPDEETQT
jgi:hypothetical protein